MTNDIHSTPQGEILQPNDPDGIPEFDTPRRHIPRHAGDRYGRLVLIEKINTRPGKLKRWRCQCDCGNIVVVNDGNLTMGHTRSCGCGATESRKGFYERNKATIIKHGLSKTHTYTSWEGLIARCTNPNSIGWTHYGGRGIGVCDRWRSFEAFYADMGECPPGLSIDRIDNNGNYEPGNCRWADNYTQNRNQSNNRWITFRDKTMIITDWARELKISRGTISTRLRNGWSVENAFTTPPHGKRSS